MNGLPQISRLIFFWFTLVYYIVCFGVRSWQFAVCECDEDGQIRYVFVFDLLTALAISVLQLDRGYM